MFTTAEPLGRCRAMGGEKTALCSWYLIGLVPASHQGPTYGPRKRGGQGETGHCGQRGWMGQGLASKPEQAVSNKTPAPNLPFALSSFGFIRFIGNLLHLTPRVHLTVLYFKILRIIPQDKKSLSPNGFFHKLSQRIRKR